MAGSEPFTYGKGSIQTDFEATRNLYAHEFYD